MARVLTFALLLCACAGAPPPAPRAGANLLAAQVDAAEPPHGDRRFVIAVVQLTNASDRPVTVDRYLVEWDDGSVLSDRAPFVVAPGATIWRRLVTRAYDARAVAAGRVTVETDTAVRASVLR